MADIEPVWDFAQQHVVDPGTGLYGIEQLTGFRRRIQECFLFLTLSCTSASVLKVEFDLLYHRFIIYVK